MTDALSRRIDADPESVEQGLAQLVLTIVDLLRELMERQALRRIDGGHARRRAGRAARRAPSCCSRSAWTSSTAEFGLTREDLNLNLGPLGNLM